MTEPSAQDDLVVLAADLDIEYSMRGLLSRPWPLRIRSIRYSIRRHVERDPGCLQKSADFLAPLRRLYEHALVIFDREGSGKERSSREELEAQVERSLETVGWNRSRVAAVVLDPEVEIWVWSDSPEVETALGWKGRHPKLRAWLEEKGFISAGERKPSRPKEAMRAALRAVDIRRPSASIFEVLARTVSVNRCTDPAFLKLKATLQNWFPAA